MTFPRRKCPQCQAWLELYYRFGQAYEACARCGWAPRFVCVSSTQGLQTAPMVTDRTDAGGDSLE